MSDEHKDWPLTCAQRWLHYAGLTRPVHRLFDLSATMPSPRKVRAAVRRVAQRHPSLRMQIRDTPKGPRQRFTSCEPLFAAACLRGTPEGCTRAVRDLLLAEADTPMDCRSQSPIRVLLVAT